MDRRDFLRTALSAAAMACAGPRASPGGGAPAGGPSGGPRGKRILVLGGTGFLGPAFVDAARSRGHVLTLFNRGKTHPGMFPDVEQLHGDRDGQLDALRGRTWDAVLDTSGYVPRVVRQSAELLAPAVQRYLFVSTISVYADDIPPGADEGAKLAELPDPRSEDVPKYYGGLKVACERAVEAALPGRVAVVRPGLIVGPGDPTDRFTYWPVRLDRGGEVLAPGDGGDPVQVIDVRDLAEFMVGLLERGDVGTWNAVGPASRLVLRDLLAQVAAGVGAAPALRWVPWSFLAQEKVTPWGDMPAVVPGAESALAQVSIARALAKGIRFRPVADTARDTLAWWKGLPEARRARLRAGISPEREAEVLARWKARG